MQLMSWSIARLGSRFALFLEPYKRRVLHSALGRFCDQALDLQVGLVEPDGTRRVLPFTCDPEVIDLANCEQFERFNSITYRGHSEKYNLRFEFNIHSVFYPQDERLCTTPAFYLELRVSPIDSLRENVPVDRIPDQVELFIRLKRPATKIKAFDSEKDNPAHIDLSYSASPQINTKAQSANISSKDKTINIQERIVSLNNNATMLKTGDGLKHTLPVTEAGSGVKWRLVWAAHVDQPVLNICDNENKNGKPAHFRYRKYLKNLDQVVQEAVITRDNRLSLSRRLEKLLEQSPTLAAEHHLYCQSFQAFLANTFWCDVDNDNGKDSQWFSVLEGTAAKHSSIDEQYNTSMFYFAFWPKLLQLQIEQWANFIKQHQESGGAVVPHNLGNAMSADDTQEAHTLFTSQNCGFLLLLQTYIHWTGDKSLAGKYAGVVQKLCKYLIWNDINESEFFTQETTTAQSENSDDALFARKYTYLAVKRASALRAASDILLLSGDHEASKEYEQLYKKSIDTIEQRGWWMDHYVMCLDSFSAPGINPLLNSLNSLNSSDETDFGLDAYSIHTGDGLVLPMLIGQELLLNQNKLRRDINSSLRENLTRYGCGHTSIDIERLSISQNLWRDLLADYLDIHTDLAQCYWDLQVASNTNGQSLGYTDTYINRYLCFYPRGVTAMGRLLSGPRISIDRLQKGETKITVCPNRNRPQRWPLVALADWEAGKIPVCVVDEQGQVTIEGQIDPVNIAGG